MRDFLVKLLLGVITLGLGAFVGIYTKAWQDKKAVQTRSLDASVAISKVIERLAISGRSLEVRLDNKPIQALSQVSIKLFNANDRPYEDIPAYVDIKSAQGESLEIISEEVAGANGLRETITKDNSVSQNNAGNIHLGYRIKTANPLGLEPILVATYLVEGRPTEATLRIDKTGLNTRQFDFSSFFISPWYKSDLLFGIGFIVFYILISYLFITYARRANAKQKAKHDAYLKEKLTERINGLGDKPDVSTIVEAVSDIDNRYRWENTPALLRRLMRLKQPAS